MTHHTIPFEIESAKRELLRQAEEQNNLRLSPTRFTSHILTDAAKDRYIAHLIGPFNPNTPSPAANEFRIYAQITAWNDGHCFVQFILQDCEGDFINLTPDNEVTEHLNLHPFSYRRRN